jgi:hypothetical protein
MTLGTLRDQVIYPDGKEDQKKRGISDQVRAVYILCVPSMPCFRFFVILNII